MGNHHRTPPSHESKPPIRGKLIEGSFGEEEQTGSPGLASGAVKTRFVTPTCRIQRLRQPKRAWLELEASDSSRRVFG